MFSLLISNYENLIPLTGNSYFEKQFRCLKNLSLNASNKNREINSTV